MEPTPQGYNRRIRITTASRRITIRCTRSRGSRGFQCLVCLPRPGDRCRYHFSCSFRMAGRSSLWSRFGSVSRSARSKRQHARASAVDAGLSQPSFTWVLFALPRLIRYAWCHRRGRSAPGTSLWFSRARWSGKPSHKLP